MIMNPENSFDAIVAGAGPAGSTLAYILASNGFKVLIIDTQTFPRNKLCGGLVTRKTVKLLEHIFKTSPGDLKDAKIITGQDSRYRVQNNSGAFIEGRLHFPFHFVQRRAYDHFFLNRARQAGAEFIAAEKVLAADPVLSKIVTRSGKEYHARFIIGADGALSRMRAALVKNSFIREKPRDGLATALEFFVSRRQASQLPDFPVIYFGHTPWGYAWCFPGENTKVLGICALNTKAGKRVRSRFAAFLKSHGITDARMNAFKSSALPYGNFLTHPGHDNILLVGDACGLADPLLGEGIYYAHKSAQLAARAVMKSYHHPPGATRRYARYLDQTILTELRYVSAGRRLIFSLPGNWPYRAIAFMLRVMPRKCEEAIQGQRSFRWLRPIAAHDRRQENSARKKAE